MSDSDSVVPDDSVESVHPTKPSALAIRRVLYALMVGLPQWADAHWDFIKTIARYDNSDINGRVWWRMPKYATDPEGFERGYVCLNPGEFRITPPEGPGNIIREAPATNQPLRLSDLLRKHLHLLETYGDDLDDELKELKQSAEYVLRNMESEQFAEGLDAFREASLNLRTGEWTSAQEVVNDLYKRCLFGFLLPGSTFAMAMALLQIEMGVNLWVGQDAYLDIRAYLCSYLGVLAKSNPVILEGAAKIGNWHFDDGQSLLKEALSCVTLETFYRNLYLAAHHFWAACAIAKDTQALMPKHQLHYTALIAEESYSCVITGLSADIEEFADGNRESFQEELIYYLESGQEEKAQHTLRNITRPTNPVLPRHYAQVSMARALIHTGGEKIRKGIDMLLSLEKEFQERVTLFEDYAQELNRIESGLMVGYRDSGDEEAAKMYAAKLVGRNLVGHLFGKS